MKLVELLAKEIDKWPDGVVRICQSLVDSELYGDNSNGSCIFRMYPESAGNTPISEDSYDYVSRAQWQSERDRQKGGEWKRHRGGSQPVDNAVYVEVKLRCGDVQQSHAQDFLWQHKECDVSANIMQYRVISQPQAEEVWVTEFKIPEGAKVEFARGSKIDPPKDHEWQTIGYVPELKKPESSGPLAWRDTINELDAYIEEFTREREALINRLAEEGFALIPAMTAVMGVADVDMGDWRNWQEGDVVKVIEEFDRYEIGDELYFNKHDFDDSDQPINLKGHNGSSWPETHQVEFVSRP